MMRGLSLRLLLLIACTAVVLGIASAVGIAMAVGPPGPRPLTPWTAGCPTPALSGTVVDVTLSDMAGSMGPGMMGRAGMMGNGPDATGGVAERYPGMNGWPGNHMMHVFVAPSAIPAGTVSLRVHNIGALTHEVILLPLGSGRFSGQRSVGVDGRVDESGSLGEASRSCGADEGDGILAGAQSWTTITLAPGRYELACNIAGHYAAGMYSELDVASSE
jgi:hypothetical protein